MAKLHKNHFAICIDGGDNCDLQVWKLYQILPDATAEMEDYLRVIDESGEDYLYPASRFVIVEFAQAAEKKILSAVSVVS